MKTQWQPYFKKLLKECFDRARSKNPRFSVRAFAKKVGLSSSSTSDLLSGKEWTPSKDRVQKILANLEVGMMERAKLAMLMGLNSEEFKTEIPESDYPHFANPYYVPILVAHALPGPLKTLPALAKRFQISEEMVAATRDHLVANRYLYFDEERGEFSKHKKILTSKDETPATALKKFHSDNLHKALSSLENHAIQERDFTSLVFVGRKDQLQELKAEIRKTYESVLARTGAPGDEIFQLSISLIPLNELGGKSNAR